jgi:hypothetical protein
MEESLVGERFWKGGGANFRTSGGGFLFCLRCVFFFGERDESAEQKTFT